MLNILQNSHVWITLGFVYLGLVFFIIGLARHQNNLISGFGIVLMVASFIYGIISTTFLTSIVILVFAYLTRQTIPGYLAYLYWKLRFHPKYLTPLRFKFLVSDQDSKPQSFPPLTELVIDTATEKKLASRSVLEGYIKDLLESNSKYVVNEVLGNYDLFSSYVELRSKYNSATANNVMKSWLGIIPLSPIELDLKMDEFNQAIKELNKKNKN